MPSANRYFVPSYAYHLTHRCHNRDPSWTDSLAVGSESFVREVASRIRGRQKLEMVEEGDRWVLKELSVPYRAEGDRGQHRGDDVQGTA